MTQIRLSVAAPSRIFRAACVLNGNSSVVYIARGWRLVEHAIRTSNCRKKRALSLQVRDPHDCDHVPIVVRLLLRVLIAGPDKIFLGRKGLSLLLDPHLPFSDMA